MSVWESVFVYGHQALIGIGIGLNLVLFYAVLKKTPTKTHIYSLMLINFCVSDFLTCCVSFFVLPRVMVNGDSILYISHGLCQLLGKRVCVVGYSFMCSLYAHLNWCLLSSFVYRYWVVKFSIPTRKQVFGVIFLNWIPIVIGQTILLSYFLTQWDKNFDAAVKEIHPEVDLSVYGAEHVSQDWRASVPTALICVPIFPVTAVVFFLRHHILKRLNRHSVMAPATKKMHRAFLRALTMQALLPPFYLAGITLFIVDTFFQIHHPVLEYGLYFLTSLIPIFNPLFPLIFVTPYRQVVLGFIPFLRRCRQILSRGSLVTDSTSPNAWTASS